MLDIKNYWTKKLPHGLAGYSYIIAFGVPMIIVTLISSDLLYERYLGKLARSH